MLYGKNFEIWGPVYVRATAELKRACRSSWSLSTRESHLLHQRLQCFGHSRLHSPEGHPRPCGRDSRYFHIRTDTFTMKLSVQGLILLFLLSPSSSSFLLSPSSSPFSLFPPSLAVLQCHQLHHRWAYLPHSLTLRVEFWERTGNQFGAFRRPFGRHDPRYENMSLFLSLLLVSRVSQSFTYAQCHANTHTHIHTHTLTHTHTPLTRSHTHSCSPKVALDVPEPRVHFALVCGAKSCPPIKTYSSTVSHTHQN